ncbi:hypothetical protein C483_02166 [Natrialba hulunbeirensis JCM 10989]|uniref:Uncharacterized protein n=1 Tax=Natrialba hulunbeirensis JCM 10989 TaxID=1227493 RepID=M0A9S5_9EURY|nr:hypothetical protein [Natrialba hulunbeirensis]ELY95131.1 hypothetical protein C483_02166 [Natrialba hulunbeirensis JCM 10989]
MSIDKHSLKGFAEEMQEEYEDRSLLPDLFTVRDFKGRKDSKLEYLQFGKRTGVPTNIFEQGVTLPTTSSFIRSVVNGEKKFVLTDLANSAGDERFGSKQIEGELSPDDIELAVENTVGADRLFLPISDDYTDPVMDWVGDQRFSLSPEGKLVVNGVRLDIDRVSSNYGIRDVIVANSSRVSVVQKRFEDAQSPKGMEFDKSLTSVNEEEKLMVYFGKEIEPAPIDSDFEEEIEVMYRSVISQPIIDNGGVFVLEASPDLTLGRKDDN